MYEGINTIALFKDTLTGTSGTTLSDPIDIRDISKQGDFTLSYIVNGTGGGTAGTTNFSYLGADTFDGVYRVPSGAGAIGTSGVADGNSDKVNFTPVVTPFMKIKVVCGTSNPSLVTANLNVR